MLQRAILYGARTHCSLAPQLLLYTMNSDDERNLSSVAEIISCAYYVNAPCSRSRPSKTIEEMDVASRGSPAAPPAAPPATSQEDLLSNVLIIIMSNLIVLYCCRELEELIEKLSDPQSVWFIFHH